MKTEHLIALWAIPAGVVGTIIGAVLGARLTARAVRHRDEQIARDELERLADEFADAVLAVRITGHTSDFLWNGRNAVLKTILMAGTQFAAGMLTPTRTGAAAISEGSARASALIAFIDGNRNQAATEVATALKHAIRCSMPLARHEHTDVAATTDAVLDALLHHRSQPVLNNRLRAFRNAVRTAATPPPSRWRRARARCTATVTYVRARLGRAPASTP
ncbi:hypothetical protein ACFXEL_11100 [Streptomyces sp. NPDC059382]|uniref:hypothetical protein n=1 Tax=Streptomyces sp. NPDC059382 TaxID=3346816 RepID=UPI00368D0AFA